MKTFVALLITLLFGCTPAVQRKSESAGPDERPSLLYGSTSEVLFPPLQVWVVTTPPSRLEAFREMKGDVVRYASEELDEVSSDRFEGRQFVVERLGGRWQTRTKPGSEIRVKKLKLSHTDDVSKFEEFRRRADEHEAFMQKHKAPQNP